ncbi:hypothetical protein C5L38_34945 (plasmid) [Streptomyces sp. WAC00288]|uniref:DUF7848 domain-containing protein n=1 Tax=Streptomyces sp. WAC00288 TaxID=2094021 RepID=UPI000788BC63|nr:hypothetical protein C5L38_34945 [Streptomyces sp. WAC00288]KYG51035.1 hypothetical protein AWI43_31705 [Streptomyces sp. WAC04657]
MKATTVLRHVSWTIGPDPDRDPPAMCAACKDCGEKSSVTTDRKDSDMWALEHAGRTGHRRYDEIVSVGLYARPADEELR